MSSERYQVGGRMNEQHKCSGCGYRGHGWTYGGTVDGLQGGYHMARCPVCGREQAVATARDVGPSACCARTWLATV